MLRLIGNGVSPPQAALAWHLLTDETRGTRPMSDPVNTDAPQGLALVRELATRHPDHPRTRSVLDELLGQLAEMAEAASKRRPKNRPSEFAEWTPPALRQLAALCKLYATAIPAPHPDDEGAPVGRPVDSTPGTGAPQEDSAAEIERIEAEIKAAAPTPMEQIGTVLAEGVAAIEQANPTDSVTATTVAEAGQILAAVISDAVAPHVAANGGYPFSDPAPWSEEPAPVPAAFPWDAFDGFSNPAPWREDDEPAPVGHAPDGSDDGIPF
jgi:hypothetical protein